MPAAERTTGNLFRRFTLGSGALKRGSDRLQFLARLLLVLALMAAVPMALVVGSEAYTLAEGRAATEAATRHPATARLMEDASPPQQPSGDEAGDPAEARVSWPSAPQGDRQEQVVQVPPGAVTGSTVTIWVDEEGRLTFPPLSNDDVRREGVASGVGTFTAMSVLALLAYQGCRMLMDRSRLRRWAADWAVVEPVWSRTIC